MAVTMSERPIPTGEGLTFEKVWAMFQETDRKMQETDRKMQETERQMKEDHERRMKEFDRISKEADERRKQADEEAAKRRKEADEEAAKRRKEAAKEAEERRKEADERRKEADERWKKINLLSEENEKQIASLNKQMGGLHNSFGQMAEHLVAPGIVDKFNELGFHITQAAVNGLKILDEKKDIRAEIDLYMGNGDYIIGVEVKAKLGKDDVEKHKRRLAILREENNKTGDRRKIVGGIAVAILSEGDKEAILNAGFYLLVQTGDTMKIDMPEGFVPREW